MDIHQIYLILVEHNHVKTGIYQTKSGISS